MSSSSASSPNVIAASQARAARGLVGWSQAQLAEKAGVPLPTLERLEAAGVARMPPGVSEKVRAALEAAGVKFIPENGGGAGVRWRKGPEPQTIAFEDLNASNDE